MEVFPKDATVTAWSVTDIDSWFPPEMAAGLSISRKPDGMWRGTLSAFPYPPKPRVVVLRESSTLEGLLGFLVSEWFLERDRQFPDEVSKCTTKSEPVAAS